MTPEEVKTLPEEYRDIAERLLMPVDTNIDINRVILSDENRAKINDFIKQTQYRDKLIEYGLQPDNRLLFYGASGTGKTFLSKALSNHLGYTMLYVDIAKALSEGNVAMNISDVFKLANYLGNCIIFFDECDSIAWNRDAGNAEGGTVRRAQNSTFQALDQMNPNNIFIAATNMLHRLDAAFERRFSMKLEFRRPSLNIKECITKFIKPMFEVADDVDPRVEEIVERKVKQYAKLSYYEIENIVNRAMKDAILNDTQIVKTSTIYDMFQTAMGFKIRMGTNQDSEEMFHNNNVY